MNNFFLIFVLPSCAHFLFWVRKKRSSVFTNLYFNINRNKYQAFQPDFLIFFKKISNFFSAAGVFIFYCSRVWKKEPERLRVLSRFFQFLHRFFFLFCQDGLHYAGSEAQRSKNDDHDRQPERNGVCDRLPRIDRDIVHFFN